jgi:hypothetical protein
VKTVTNKRLLISESRGDSNWCTPYREKPDQNTTRFPRSVCVWSKTIRISRGPHIETLHEMPTDLDRSHCSRHNPQHVDWLILGSIPSFSPEPTNEAGGRKPSSCQWPTTRLTEPISPACDQCIQYLLAGANTSVLNRYKRGIQLWRCRVATYHSLTFPTNCLHFPPTGTARSPV